jgi:hypothetical protein
VSIHVLLELPGLFKWTICAIPFSGYVSRSTAELNVGNALGDLAQVLAVGHDICGKRHARLCPVPILGDSH